MPDARLHTLTIEFLEEPQYLPSGTIVFQKAVEGSRANPSLFGCCLAGDASGVGYSASSAGCIASSAGCNASSAGCEMDQHC